jgi:hypothetical protein
VFIENRFDYAVIDSIMNARKNLPSDTIIYVVTSKRLTGSFRKLNDRAGPLVVRTDIVYMEHASKKTEPYSLLLTSEEFWQAFTTDYVLIFQRDSRFCARSRRKLTDFIGRFDYVGAPWSPTFAKSAGYTLHASRCAGGVVGHASCAQVLRRQRRPVGEETRGDAAVHSCGHQRTPSRGRGVCQVYAARYEISFAHMR